MVEIKGGWLGKILRINLSDESIAVQKLDKDFMLKYIGGRGFAVRILWDELPRGVDPLSPENKLIVATGPLTGLLVPSSGKVVLASKSPLTGGYGDGNIGTHLSAMLKMSGFDAIVIEGKADKPKYIYITPNGAEIRDAEHLWGKGAITTDIELRHEHGENIGTLVIGPGGERLVKYAVVITEFGRAGGRPGIGAVFGSKNLKAIVAEGWMDIPVADMDELVKLMKKSIEFLKSRKGYELWVSQGTMFTIQWSQENSVLPTFNFDEGVFDEYWNISGEAMAKMYKVLRKGCLSCPMPCGNLSRAREKFKNLWSELDYENVAMFGSNIGIGDMDVVIRLNYLADQWGVDTISMGSAIAFAIEAFKKGLITEKDTEGLKLDFGNVESILKLAEMIVERRSIGDLLAEGVKTAAEKLGGEAYKFAMHVKGLEISAYDCHAAPGMALAYGVSPIGAHHKDAWFISWEIKMGREVVSREKVEKLILMQRIRGGIFETLTVCRLPWIELGLEMEVYPRMLKAATGVDFTLEQLYLIADRVYNLMRAFWIREYGGWKREYDYPPAKWFEKPLTKGPFAGWTIKREIYDKLLSYYYELRKWDENGIPTREAFRETGLEDVAEELSKIVELK